MVLSAGAVAAGGGSDASGGGGCGGGAADATAAVVRQCSHSLTSQAQWSAVLWGWSVPSSVTANWSRAAYSKEKVRGGGVVSSRCLQETREG